MTGAAITEAASAMTVTRVNFILAGLLRFVHEVSIYRIKWVEGEWEMGEAGPRSEPVRRRKSL